MFFLQLLLGLGLQLYPCPLFRPQSQSCWPDRSVPFLLSLTAFLPNALELPLEEVQDVFDRLSLPLKGEVEGKKGKEVAHVDDDDADGHDIDGMLCLGNSSDNFKPHVLHEIVVQPDKDVRTSE